MTRFAFTFLSPHVLLVLVGVALVALWTLFRPGRELLVVSSLRLWRQAAQSPEARQRFPSRRISLPWLLLLGGAVAAVLAGARPTFLTHRPARRISVAVYSSAEFGPHAGIGQLRRAAGSLMGRLEKHDQVQLLLPDALGGASGWMSPADAENCINDIVALPARARNLTIPAASPDARKIFVLIPAGSDVISRSGEEVIELPAGVFASYIEAASGNGYPDSRAEILINVANPTGEKKSLIVTSFKNASSRGSSDEFPDDAVVYKLRARAAMAFELAGGVVSSGVYLVRRPVRKIKVAMKGEDMPMLRRLLNAARNLEMAASESQADVVVVNGVSPPPGRSAIVFNPPTVPTGWRAGKTDERVMLRDADMAVDDEVMKDVDFAPVALRRMTAWISENRPSQKRLASFDGAAFILRGESKKSGQDVRRVYVAFDPAESNTNFGMTEAFVIFMANCIQWLAPAENGHEVQTSGDVQAVYGYVTPLEAADWRQWQRIYPKQAEFTGPLASPGIYKDSDGKLYAVSLPGVKAGFPSVDPMKLIADTQLPKGEMLKGEYEFWPALAVLAAALWLAGWIARVK